MFYQNKNLNELVDNLKKELDTRLKSVFIYGSKANSGTADSDTDLMIIVKNLSAEDISICSNYIKAWVKKKNPVPVFMGEEEWFASCDVYPMEYADIKANHEIVYGENLISGIEVKSSDLRLQCEHTAKNILMRYRKFYALNPGRRELEQSFIPAIKDVTAVLKAILRIKQTDVPRDVEDIIKLSEKIGIEGTDIFGKLVSFKLKKCKIEDVDNAAKNFLNMLDKLLKYTNDMEN